MKNDAIERFRPDESVFSQIEHILHDKQCFGPRIREDSFERCKYEVQYPLKYLGAGMDKIAFAYHGNCCLKLQRKIGGRRDGVRQEISVLSLGLRCFPIMYDYDRVGFQWVSEELCRPVKSQDILVATGNSFDSVDGLKSAFESLGRNGYNIENTISVETDWNIINFLRFMKTNGCQQMAFRDFTICMSRRFRCCMDSFKMWNIGIAERNGHDVMVVVDAS